MLPPLKSGGFAAGNDHGRAGRLPEPKLPTARTGYGAEDVDATTPPHAHFLCFKENAIFSLINFYFLRGLLLVFDRRITTERSSKLEKNREVVAASYISDCWYVKEGLAILQQPCRKDIKVTKLHDKWSWFL